MDLTSTDPVTFELAQVDGRRVWLTSTGRVLPFVAGGDGPDGGEGGDGTGGEGGEGTGSDETGNDGGEGDDGEAGEKLTLTQAELDRMIDKRLGRAKTKWETELKAYTDAEGQSEADRLKSEKEAAEQAAQQVTERANQKLIAADAKVAAVGAGAKPDRITALLKLVDLSDIDVDDDGTPDLKAIEKAVKKGLVEYPEFKAGANGGRNGSSGGEFNGNNGETKPATMADAVTARLGG
jgi:hypothetical protein